MRSRDPGRAEALGDELRMCPAQIGRPGAVEAAGERRLERAGRLRVAGGDNAVRGVGGERVRDLADEFLTVAE